MKYVLNGPIERALSVADLPIAQPTVQNSTRIFLVAGISILVGASILYIVIKQRNKNQEVNADNNKS